MLHILSKDLLGCTCGRRHSLIGVVGKFGFKSCKSEDGFSSAEISEGVYIPAAGGTPTASTRRSTETEIELEIGSDGRL